MNTSELLKWLVGASLALGTCCAPRAALAATGDAGCKQYFDQQLALCAPIFDERELQKQIADTEKAKGDVSALTDTLKVVQAKTQKLRQDSPNAILCDALKKDWPEPHKDCDHLATLLDEVFEGLADKKPSTPKDLAPLDAEVQRAQLPENRTATNKSGSPAQASAVESLQPINLAGGAFSLAGTRAGTRGVATITINPLALGDPKSAVSGRLFDLSVTAPFAFDGSSDQNLRFIGVRARVNATAPISTTHLNQVLRDYYAASGKFADDLTEVLKHSEVKTCADSIVATRKIAVEACGTAVFGAAELARLRANTLAEVALARKEADRYYLGLDLRLDSGDPTGTLIAGDRGTRLLGALGGGLRVTQGETWGFELRGHLGGDYFRGLDELNGERPDPVFSVDWGGALVLAGHVPGPTEKQRITFGAGVQGRNAKSSASADAAPTNFVNLNLMAIVPAAGGVDMGLSVSVPLLDSDVPQGTIVSFSTDLGLLDGSASGSGG